MRKCTFIMFEIHAYIQIYWKLGHVVHLSNLDQGFVAAMWIESENMKNTLQLD